MDALREELELLGEQIDELGTQEGTEPTDDHDLPSLEQAALDAEEAEADALTDQENAARAHEKAARASTTLETEARLARDALDAALSEPLETVDEEREAEDIAALEAQAAGKQEDLDRLISSAPDLEALEAERDRIVSARRAALDERRRIGDEISELNGLIGARGEDNVEARLAATADALVLAEEREQRYAMEVAALKMLLSELDGARRAARDAYFGPVYEQLTPLLAMLHEGAEIEMDGETMLPARIVRNGVAEDIENLSGGASEQVAILTRLAFARLYARAGKSVPVILDDALVYSDDDRIVRMFTALTRIARDQQIIVVSCRQRAFEELGGHRPRISTSAAAG